jgi:hypothetical protein
MCPTVDSGNYRNQLGQVVAASTNGVLAAAMGHDLMGGASTGGAPSLGTTQSISLSDLLAIRFVSFISYMPFKPRQDRDSSQKQVLEACPTQALVVKSFSLLIRRRALLSAPTPWQPPQVRCFSR